MKACSKCGDVLSLDAFCRDRSKPDGRRPDCRACKKAINAAHYAANQERMRAQAAAWLAANKERKKATKAAHYAANRDRIDARTQARARGLVVIELVRRAERLAAFAGLCGLCGLPIDPVAMTLDHVQPIIDGGVHSRANTQPAHGFCNDSKGRSSLQEAVARLWARPNPRPTTPDGWAAMARSV